MFFIQLYLLLFTLKQQMVYNSFKDAFCKWFGCIINIRYVPIFYIHLKTVLLIIN